MTISASARVNLTGQLALVVRNRFLILNEPQHVEDAGTELYVVQYNRGGG